MKSVQLAISNIIQLYY